MNPQCWPTWLDDIWAKSPDKGEGGEPETLAQHTWYVTERLADFIRLRPNLPARLGIPRLWHILYWSAFLHDFGKATVGFQRMLRGGERWSHRHEVVSLAFLEWIAGNFSIDEQLWIAATIVSHHRDADLIHSLYYPCDDPEDDQLIEVIAELENDVIRGLWRWIAECSAAWLDASGLRELGVDDVALLCESAAFDSVRLDGVDHVNTWLKAYNRFVRSLSKRPNRIQVLGTLALRGHMTNADHSASAHAGALPTVKFKAEDVLHSRNLTMDKLFDHQLAAAETIGSALLTAPTGSGKTEAALLWAAKQAEYDDNVPRLFYTLPYQASMNAMKLRLDETFGDTLVGIQHGRGLLAVYRMLLEREYEPHQAARQARWLKNLAQLNYQPVRVFSPYQMLKAMYRLKGYEARLNDYHNALFIFDEIHAYEVRRLAMILETMRYLADSYNARFFIMSATFPSLIKDWLNDTLADPFSICAAPSLFQDFTRHRLELQDGEVLDVDNLRRIEEDALRGKSVLVVCNIVDRAQSVFEHLSESLSAGNIDVELLHGRFNMRDRSRKEQIIRDATGSKSKGRRPIVLVATQAVEVSLDIDLDTIYTEPAPLEALVQRFGRINRRGKQAAPAPVHVFKQPNDGQNIYDPELVIRTLSILEREQGQPIDESRIGLWLDEIYEGDIADRWIEEYGHAAREFRATCVTPLRAFQSDENLEDAFYKAFDGVEVLPISLYDEYIQLREGDPIRAGELLVTIRWGRWHALANQGRILPREKYHPYIVRTQYDSMLGLTFADELVGEAF